MGTNTRLYIGGYGSRFRYIYRVKGTELTLENTNKYKYNHTGSEVPAPIYTPEPNEPWNHWKAYR